MKTYIHWAGSCVRGHYTKSIITMSTRNFHPSTTLHTDHVISDTRPGDEAKLHSYVLILYLRAITRRPLPWLLQPRVFLYRAHGTCYRLEWCQEERRQSCPQSQILLDTMWKKARPDVDPGLDSEESKDACSGLSGDLLMPRTARIPRPICIL